MSHPLAPAPVAPPPLGAWSRVWRYGVVALVALLVWVLVAWDSITASGTREEPPPGDVGPVGAALALDALLGLAAVALLPLRRRHPVLVGVLTTGATALSGSALGAAALAVVSLSTRRRWREVVPVVGVLLAATLVYEVAFRPAWAQVDLSLPGALGSVALALVAAAALVATGSFVGARRELLVQLRERAETAEQQRALAEEAAREGERLRIAREMHDVLAHRISLVGLHAGALAYRTDLGREETAQVATVVQENAHLALEELREVLGVLRQGADGAADAEAVAEPPQPTLAELPALVADARDAGQTVTLRLDVADGHDLARVPATASRTAFRVVQEGLTNARKHAPGSPVDVVVTVGAAHAVHVRVVNGAVAPVGAGAGPAGGVPPWRPPGAGVGLTGLEERADLAGGRLRAGPDASGRFVLELDLPGGAA
ncbi:sensor histidine kinase [Cellulomonas endophytica]|uniref:sensor histidine kinase n=1 Tax=Cellulomonas endophytica TaxID=2494735 RepID=UPI001011AE13|nr:histidine kinase [Cellulomonas endophytica]